jgi:phosphatidylserine/phosphatidylglycerophosphate/cardiolipin synthase-like enzyme
MRLLRLSVPILKCLARSLFFAAFILTLSASSFALDFQPAQVADISDRKYEPALQELIDSARQSIVMSMYIFKPNTAPVKKLSDSLLSARKRGVAIELYFNTQFDSNEERYILDYCKELIDAGAKVYLTVPSIKLHDKLIIVDGRYVIDGSMNWSVSAFRTNYGSVVVVDSPGLAKDKLERLINFKLADEATIKKITEHHDPPAEVLEPLPDIVSVPKIWVEDSRLFARMLFNRANRDFQVYLLLYARSIQKNSDHFYVDLEELARGIKLPEDWSASGRRRQVIKILRRLSKSYGVATIINLFICENLSLAGGYARLCQAPRCNLWTMSLFCSC